MLNKPENLSPNIEQPKDKLARYLQIKNKENPLKPLDLGVDKMEGPVDMIGPLAGCYGLVVIGKNEIFLAHIPPEAKKIGEELLALKNLLKEQNAEDLKIFVFAQQITEETPAELQKIKNNQRAVFVATFPKSVPVIHEYKDDKSFVIINQTEKTIISAALNPDLEPYHNTAIQEIKF
jgi:hypothetical protein